MKKFFTGAVLAFMPMLVMAQVHALSILGTIQNILKVIIPILITAALVFFIFGVIKYVIADNSDDQAKAKSIIARGIIGLFVILSVWGLIGVIQSTFGIGAGGDIEGYLPSVT